MLKQQTFFNIYEPKFQFMIFTPANNHFIIRPSSVTLTFNLPVQMFQTRVIRRQRSTPYLSLPFTVTK